MARFFMARCFTMREYVVATFFKDSITGGIVSIQAATVGLHDVVFLIKGGVASVAGGVIIVSQGYNNDQLKLSGIGARRATVS